MGREQGLSEAKLRGLASFEDDPALDELERTVLRYAVAMTATPAEIPDELYGALRERLRPEQLVELTSAIAWENYRARYDHAFACEAEGFSEGAFCPLPSAAAKG